MDRDQDLLDYFQDRLTPERKAAFEHDLMRDPALKAELEVMRSARAALAKGSKHENADAVWERLSANIDAEPKGANDNRPLWKEVLKYAAVAFVSVSTWQFAVSPIINADPGGFRTASEEQVDFSFQVKFTESASYGDIVAALAPLGARVTDGPSALGLVRLSFSDETLRQEAMSVLEANSDLVEFVAD